MARSARQRATDWIFAHLLPLLLTAALRLVYASIRWSVQGLENLAPFWGAGRPVIVCCWHGRLVMIPPVWLRHGKGSVQCLMGLNRNGELITRIVKHFNMQAIRGSSRSGGKEARDEMALKVKADPATTLALTPDGPHGPPLVSKIGLAQVSRECSLPVIWVSAAASRAVRLGTWDRFALPLPFSRVTVRFSPPMFPDAWAQASLEEYRQAIDQYGRDELGRVDQEYRPASG